MGLHYFSFPILSEMQPPPAPIIGHSQIGRIIGGRKYIIYRVFFFSKGPTQKSSKYGIGPSQQDKIAKYTGPTQSYQM